MLGLHKFSPPIPPAWGPTQGGAWLVLGVGPSVGAGLHLSGLTVGEQCAHISPSWRTHRAPGSSPPLPPRLSVFVAQCV